VFIAACALVARFAPFVSAAAATAITLEVGATGGLPGFHSGELRRYLALHMTEIGLGDWRFEPAADDASARNRVVWTFKLNPYAGGEVRRVGLPQLAERTFGIHRPITIEAWLYLNGEYQTLVEGQAIIQGARSAQESLGEKSRSSGPPPTAPSTPGSTNASRRVNLSRRPVQDPPWDPMGRKHASRSSQL
jgi:hypothetical protein